MPSHDQLCNGFRIFQIRFLEAVVIQFLDLLDMIWIDRGQSDLMFFKVIDIVEPVVSSGLTAEDCLFG